MVIFRCVIALGLLGALLVSRASAESDTQLWLDVDLAGAMSDRVQVSARQSFRFKDDVSELETYFTELLDRPMTPLRVRLYLAQEVFADEGESRLTEASRFRFFVGLRADPEDHFLFVKLQPREKRQLKADLFVMYEEQDKDDGTVNTFVVG